MIGSNVMNIGIPHFIHRKHHVVQETVIASVEKFGIHSGEGDGFSLYTSFRGWKWMLGGGFIFKIFTRIPGEFWSNLTSIFFRWVGKNHQLDCSLIFSEVSGRPMATPIVMRRLQQGEKLVLDTCVACDDRPSKSHGISNWNPWTKPFSR